jgi:methylated-DNA-[protein]-cysteine S-methyltransferase
MWTQLESPVGPVKIVAHRGAVTDVEFVGTWSGVTGTTPAPPTSARSSEAVAAARSAGKPVGDRVDDDPLLMEAARQLTAYFSRDLKEFDLPLRPDGTAFQQRVWEQLRQIPYGETKSYGEIAMRMGMNAGASRAVGMANGRNPIGIVIPCHRVVGAKGLLSGYAGGVERKQALLDLEQDALF